MQAVVSLSSPDERIEDVFRQVVDEACPNLASYPAGPRSFPAIEGA